jgi:cyclopropane fatty-acyl-phospholipid synthase-like methyltransferase
MGTCAGSSCDFEREYEIALSGPMLEIERKVQGGDYGASSWTTRDQAEAAAAALCLRPGSRLLEIGAGAGWPALLMARQSGCDVMLTDVPLSGLRAARARACREGLEPRCRLAAASGAALPFGDGAFDAIQHSDVLCCMAPKRRMLQECRRVARPGARMAFFVISLARPAEDDHERSVMECSGPPYLQAPAGYGELLEQAGWMLLERNDVTAEFARCMRVLLQETESRSAALAAILGVDEVNARLERRKSTAHAIALGLLQREFFLAG